MDEKSENRQPGAIESMVDNLDNELSNLSARLWDLQNQLSPILTPVNDEPSDAISGTADRVSPLVHRLINLQERIVSLTIEVEITQKRIEL